MLRLRRSSFINGVHDLIFNHGFRQLSLYSTSISTEVNPNFPNYLVENLGFSRQKALSTSSKLTRHRLRQGLKTFNDFYLISNANSVITFLKKIGLQQSQIQNVTAFEPRFFLCNVDKTLAPKTDALLKLGFSETDIAEVVFGNPSLLLTGLDTAIVPAIRALREIMCGCDVNNVITILKKLRRCHVSAVTSCVVPNVAFLQSHGVALDSIRSFLPRKPYLFVRKPDVFRNAVISVEEKLGIPPNAPHFLAGAEIVNSLKKKTMESKLQVYKSFGWTDSEIAILVSSLPSSISISEVSINKKLDFLMNELGFKASYLASRVVFLSYSLEKRIMPRHKLLLVLKENGLIDESFALYTFVNYSEPQFLKKFVLPFKQVHELYSKHAGISLEMLTQGSSKQSSSVV